jgi:hypothetical protein
LKKSGWHRRCNRHGGECKDARLPKPNRERNTMTDTQFDNVKPLERLTRLMVGGVLIAAIYYPGVTAYWLALLAVYPVITAIMAWDPLYAALAQLKLQLPSRSRMEARAPA